MAFQRLTIQIIERAKSDNGYIGQKEFKTADVYMFDTLIFSADALTSSVTLRSAHSPSIKSKM